MANPPENQDERFMRAALRYGRWHAGLTGTNPAVACLIVSKTGDQNQWISGRGITAKGGRPHAEPVALAQAGDHAKGATAYVTLEPCAHHGATPPCAQTLIDAGITRVVTAQLDPDLRVNTKGHHLLEHADIKVSEGICRQSASWNLRGYLSRKMRNRPSVTLKLAVTSDGYMGLRGEGQLAITGDIANAQTHLLRARFDAILIGSGTAIADDPMLTCRLAGLEDRSPLRIVLENKAEIDVNCKLVQTALRCRTIVVCPHEKLAQRQKLFVGTHCRLLAADTVCGNIALPEMLSDLTDTGVSTLLVEGGKSVAQSFLDADLVDEIIMYVSRQAMADKPQAQNNAAWISWPTAPDAIPDGFSIANHWQFGADKAIRMVRKEN